MQERWFPAALLFLMSSVVAEGQYCWDVLSIDPGVQVFVGEQEDNLIAGVPWEPDVRDEWLAEHISADSLHMRNGVLAAVLDGSMAGQDVVVEDENFWSDNLSTGAVWLVNYDAHFIGVNAPDLANLRVIMQFYHNGSLRLTLNLSGSSAFGNVHYRTAPQHFWTDTPETGDFWKIRLTLRRLTTGQPAMIWIDNIRVTESGTEHYSEVFPILGDGDYDGDVDLDDYALFFDCLSGEGIPYGPMECNVFDSNDDDDVDCQDFGEFQRAFYGDFEAPTPDPMTFVTPPFALGTDSIAMVATAASDATPPVEYYFQAVSGDGGQNDSGWQLSNVYIDSGLVANGTYTYQVKARDSAPPANETAYSDPATATTLP